MMIILLFQPHATDPGLPIRHCSRSITVVQQHPSMKIKQGYIQQPLSNSNLNFCAFSQRSSHSDRGVEMRKERR